MVGGAAFGDAVARARRLPSLRVGLHLVLVDGRPSLPPERIPDLVDAQGNLRGDMFRLGRDIFLRTEVKRQVAAEIEAQFAAYQATGLPLDHVNAHHHFHLHPTVAGQILKIGPRYGMRALRVPREPARLLNRIDPSARVRRDWLVAPWIAHLKKRARRHKLRTPDQVIGLAWSGAMIQSRFEGILRQLPRGVTEIYAHPATSSAFEGATPGSRYRDELSALTASEVVALVGASGAKLGGFSDLES
jgi:hopanoid biosynthesis associated protein HpnK